MRKCWLSLSMLELNVRFMADEFLPFKRNRDETILLALFVYRSFFVTPLFCQFTLLNPTETPTKNSTPPKSTKKYISFTMNFFSSVIPLRISLELQFIYFRKHVDEKKCTWIKYCRKIKHKMALQDLFRCSFFFPFSFFKLNTWGEFSNTMFIHVPMCAE